MAARSTLRKQLAEATVAFRTAPHNIEVEQALLGAILVNNEAFYRVSDFLEPPHFFEPIHQKLFELAGSLVRAGKIATPATLKTFLPADIDVAGLTASQYLARLAAEATSVINAEDYGRTIYDLALRRTLILIGEDMVNVAYDAPIDLAPQNQIEDAERRLYELAETGKYDGGFQDFARALTTAVEMAAQRLSARRKAVGRRHRHDRPRPHDGRAAEIGPDYSRRPSGHGQNRARHQHRLQHRRGRGAGHTEVDGRVATVNGGIVGFFSLEMSAEQLATRIIAEQTEIPSYRIRRGEIDPHVFDKIAEKAREMEVIPLYIDETGGLSIAQLAARARRLKRQRGLDLLVVDYIQLLSGLGPARRRRPRAGNHRDHDQPEGAGQGTEGADCRAVAALASGRKPRRQAAATLRPA